MRNLWADSRVALEAGSPMATPAEAVPVSALVAHHDFTSQYAYHPQKYAIYTWLKSQYGIYHYYANPVLHVLSVL